MARICIDGFNLVLPSGSGIATYARNLNAAIAALGHETQILFSSSRNLGPSNLLNQVMLFDSGLAERPRRFGKSLRRFYPFAHPLAREIAPTGDVITNDIAYRFPHADRFWAGRDIFHAANLAHGVFGRLTPIRLGHEVKTDIMHWTASLPMFEPRIANVYTLHDLIPLRLPFTTLDNKRAYYDLCKALVARADRIFTVSEHSRADIIRILGAAEDRVVNTYQSVEIPAYFLERPEDDIARELEGSFRLPFRGYFIYFGALEPKKNLRRLIEAYLASAVSTPLVVVGRPWLSPEQTKRFGEELFENNVVPERLFLATDRIRRFEYLPFESLMTLVKGARAALFPSLFEGFGLPVLEAMQLGTPVLTSTGGSLPEVAGDAAILVDPYDVSAIREGIRTLDADSGLREHLSEKGRERAEVFSKSRYHERLQKAYAPLL